MLSFDIRMFDVEGTPYLIANKIVMDAGRVFTELIGYSVDEVRHKPISEVINNMLKIDCSVDNLEINGTSDTVYLFTKAGDPIETVIFVRQGKASDEKIYIFKEKSNHCLKNKIQFVERLIRNDKAGAAVYSVPGFILLKANHRYLNYLMDSLGGGEASNPDYDCVDMRERFLGRKASVFIPDWNLSQMKKAWERAVDTKETLYITEQKGLFGDLDERCWDGTIAPLEEDDAVKYLVTIFEDISEKADCKKRLEKYYTAIDKQSYLLRTITENMDSGLFIINRDGTYEYLNECARKFTLLYQSMSRVGDSLVYTKYYDENDNELQKDQLPSARVLRGEKLQNVVIRAERTNFCEYFDFIGSPIYGPNGELTSAILSFRNVTEKYRYEKELRERKKQLETIFETMTDALFISDGEGNILYRNSVVKDIVYRPDILKRAGDDYGITQYMDLQDKIIPLEEMPLKRALKGEMINHFKLKAKRPDKVTYMDINASPVFDSEGNLSMVIMCSHDITELMCKELELIKQKEQLEAVIENMSDSLAIIDRNGKFTLSNKALREFMQTTAVGTTVQKAGDTVELGMIYYDESGERIPLEDIPSSRVLRGEKIKQQRIMMRQGGRNIYQEMSATPVFDQKGEFQFGVITSRDVTGRVEYEQLKEIHQHALLEAEIEKNEALHRIIRNRAIITQLEGIILEKNKLFTAVAHDIRNPIATLVSLLEIMEEENDSYCGYQEIISEVKAQAQNTYALVENLLEWFKSQNDWVKYDTLALNLSEAVSEVVSAYQSKAEAKNIGITNKIASDIWVSADKTMLDMVLRNLIHNAIKYTPKGGCVSVESNLSYKKVIISIKDTGIGIDTKKAKTLFSGAQANSAPGTAGEKGTGLGLLICKEFVHRSGGDIWMESIPGSGSTFYFSLPLDVELYIGEEF